MNGNDTTTNLELQLEAIAQAAGVSVARVRAAMVQMEQPNRQQFVAGPKQEYVQNTRTNRRILAGSRRNNASREEAKTRPEGLGMSARERWALLQAERFGDLG